ncbi:hypothetical protein SteCoe_1788 [Stentor coeruleus]|uniref:Uncharacterized protein n=1 Tax=Stentor coeruleus TaxID=5963 RepID=A0A1R2D0Z6_9CILI|nr:hypothetical protein SteCoe_1788 [Stentor coeruleus]
MDFDEIWDILLHRRENRKIINLTEHVILENSISSHEYYLTHRYESSENVFSGVDDEKNRCLFKLMPLPSFDDIKSVYRNLSLLQEFGETYKFTKIKDIFEIYDEQWILVIVCDYLEGLTIKEILEYSVNLEIPKEISLMIYVSILNIIEKAGEKGIMLHVLPDTIMICKEDSDENIVYSSFDNKYVLKVVTYNQINNNRSKYDIFFPYRKNSIENAYFGASYCLYILFTNQKIVEMPKFKEIDDEKRGKTLQVNDVALNAILNIVTGKNFKAESLTANSSLILWKNFQMEKYVELEELPIKDINPLITVMKFNNQKQSISAAKKILQVAGESPNEVNKVLGNSELFFDFFRVIFKHKSEIVKHPHLLNSILILLKDKTMSDKFKTTLISVGFLSLIPDFISNNVKSDLLCKLSINFAEDNTLTLQQILWDSNFIKNIMSKAFRSGMENEFIKVTMSYYGSHSLKFIYKIFDQLEISRFRIFQHIYEIPIIYKLNSVNTLFSILNKLLKKGPKTPPEDVVHTLKTLILIISEITCLQPFLELQHMKGECTSKSSQGFLTYFGKNPLLIRCSNCNSSYCVVCYEKYHKNHETKFLYLQGSMFRCNEIRDSESLYKLNFLLPKYQDDIQFFNIYKNIHEKINPSKIIIDCDKTLLSTSGIQIGLTKEAEAYFEVKIIKAGYFEDIAIGLAGTGVIYYSISGNIYRNGHVISHGPRLGSFDILGVGLFQNQVFFTYNGLLLRPIIPCFVVSPVKAYISSGSQSYIELEVKFTDWIFMRQNLSLIHQNADADALIQFIMKKVIKLNSKKETKSEDLFDRFLELLRIMSKTDLIEEMLAFKVKNFS